MKLTKHAETLIAAIQAGEGQWVDRMFLARHLQRSALNGADIAVLDLLAMNGLIEQQEASTRAPSGVKMLYRIQAAGGNSS